MQSRQTYRIDTSGIRYRPGEDIQKRDKCAHQGISSIALRQADLNSLHDIKRWNYTREKHPYHFSDRMAVEEINLGRIQWRILPKFVSCPWFATKFTQCCPWFETTFSHFCYGFATKFISTDLLPLDTLLCSPYSGSRDYWSKSAQTLSSPPT